MRTFGHKFQVTPWLGRKATALVVLSHWVPGDGKPKSHLWRSREEEALNKTLQEIDRWPVKSTIVLVTNEYEANVSSMVSRQVVVPYESWCDANIRMKFCVPWEAIKELRNASAGWAPGCNLRTTGACGTPGFDYYVYSESDIATPKESFEFWATHADSLYSRGYLLMPHREERFHRQPWVFTDCYSRDCIKRTAVYRDEAGPVELYKDPRDRMYVRPGNPYAGCFFMTRAMFDEYLASPMWDYTSALRLSRPTVGKLKQWGKRETAAGGLLWDPRYGSERGLTHLKMKVVHEMHMKKVPFTQDDYRKVAEVEGLVESCFNGSLSRGQCGPLPV